MKTIQQIIETIKSIPKLKKNKELFFNEYFQLGRIGIIETQFHPEKHLFRSRINENDESFLLADKISYPPNPSKEFGRAHIPGQTMFYGSFVPSLTGKDEIKHAYIINAYEICPFLRDKKSKGEKKITIGKWRVNCDIKLANIPFHKDFVNKTALSQNLNSEFNENLHEVPEYEESTIIWNNYISGEFAKPIDESNSSEYLISATYTEFLLNKGFDGVIYPTVQLDGRGFNFAITTDTVDKCLELEIVGEAKFYKDELQTMLDWEKRCIVEDKTLLQYVDDPEKLGKELCLKIISENKAKVANKRS